MAPTRRREARGNKLSLCMDCLQCIIQGHEHFAQIRMGTPFVMLFCVRDEVKKL